MHNTLQVFMHQLIDYAGLFPPARLDMSDALQMFEGHCQSEYNDFINYFICPALRLPEFAALLKDGKNVQISMITRGGDSSEGFCTNFASDLDALARFQNTHPQLHCPIIEARYPADLLQNFDKRESLRFLTRAAELLKGAEADKIFFEFGFFPQWEDTLASVLQLFRQFKENGQKNENNSLFGYKLRCGGLEAVAIPASENVARAISLCSASDIQFKATAGLHHPVRHYNAQLQTKMHGFFNIFFAAIFAKTHRMDVSLLKKIIRDEDENSFTFSDEFLYWQDLEVNRGEVEECRKSFAFSYGSCSFDEPIADLKKMSLL